MNRQPPYESLNSLLRELAAADDAQDGASLDVQARLLAEVRSIGARRRQRRFVAGLLMATAATVVGALVMNLRSGSVDPVPAVSPAPQMYELTTAFMPLPNAAAPAAHAYLVRLDVPRTALTRLGLGQGEVLDTTGSATVLADLLVGEDGVARAVRFVHQE